MLEPTLVTIAYTVRSEKLSEYRTLMQSLAQRINAQPGVEFSLYQVDGAQASYVEVYSCSSADAYDAIEDNLDDASRDAVAKIASEFVTTRQSVTSMQRI